MPTFRDRMRRLRALETQEHTSDQADRQFAALLAVSYGDGATPVPITRREALAVVAAVYEESDDADVSRT